MDERERHGVGNPRGAHPLNVFKCILVITNLYTHIQEHSDVWEMSVMDASLLWGVCEMGGLTKVNRF